MPRSFLFICSIGFCGGITLAEFWHPPSWLIGLGMIITISLVHQQRQRLAALGCLALTFGLITAAAAITPGATSLAQLGPGSYQVVGDIYTLPTTIDQRQTIQLSQVRVAGQVRRGQLEVYTQLFPSYRPGQELTLTCQFEPQSFKAKPSQWSRGIQGRCQSAIVTRVEPVPPGWRRWLAQILFRTVGQIRRNFSEPQASLFSGILLGSQSGMPPTLRAAFQATGTTHIVALSGFNVTIIVATMMQVLIRLMGRRWAWLPGLAVVLVFVIMTGASASVVRAAVMALTSQLGLFFGRPIAPERLLAYAAMSMLWPHPLLLWHDLGFQLSFLATIGLVFFSEPLARRLKFMPESFSLRQNLGTTLGAILMTEPLLLWRFGRLSLIAPVVNLLVLPLIPLSMGLGSLWVLAMLVHPVIGKVIQPAMDALFRLIVWLITTGAALPLAQTYLTGLIAGVVAAILVAMTVRLRQNYDAEMDSA